MSRYWTSALAIVAVAVGGSISACSNGDREQGATPLVASSTDATTDATTDDSDGTRSSTPPQPVETSVAATAPPQSTYGTTTMTAPTSPIVFPPPPLPLQPPTELSIGEPDLVGLIEGGEWLFAISPPSVAVRIDPSSGDVERLDVRVGESREGAAGHAYVGDRLWILGGPFRDTLVEIDPTAMTETRRIQLDEDHGLRQNGPSGSMWLTTR